MSATKTLDPAVLGQFTGTENWYRHSLVPGILYTDGVKYVAETAGAYWLLDKIASLQMFDKRFRREDFQVWTLTVQADQPPTVTCGDGNDREIYRETLDFTDFPEPGVTLWLTGKTIMLPSEY